MPDHPLVAEPDPAPAEWWLADLTPWLGAGRVTVASLVPSHFPAVARVLHPWWHVDERGEGPVRWATVAATLALDGPADLRPTDAATVERSQASGFDPPLVGQLDVHTAAALVEVLARATATPRNMHVAVWKGWADGTERRFPRAAMLPTEGRGHRLLRGPLEGVLTPVARVGLPIAVSGIWWPADRAWFVATEVDFAWTFVAGDERLVDELLASDRLEITRTTTSCDANELEE